MIDFTSPLPSAVTVNGRVFYLHTDFRSWLKFDRILTEKGVKKITYGDLLNTVLSGEITPYADEMEELLQRIFDFYSDLNPCPKSSGGGEKVLDYLTDSDYIFSAFMEQYGIDLCKTEMHWHKFLALLRGISDDTMLGKIMSYRGYKNIGNKSYEKQMQELKAIWALPLEYTEEEKEQIKEFDDYFG